MRLVERWLYFSQTTIGTWVKVLGFYLIKTLKTKYLIFNFNPNFVKHQLKIFDFFKKTSIWSIGLTTDLAFERKIMFTTSVTLNLYFFSEN